MDTHYTILILAIKILNKQKLSKISEPIQNKKIHPCTWGGIEIMTSREYSYYRFKLDTVTAMDSQTYETH